MDILNLMNDEDGKSTTSIETVAFHGGDHGFQTGTIRRSKHVACSAFSFVEVPAGFTSKERIADRNQTAVVLSGKLRATGADNTTVELGPGEVFRQHVMEQAEHVLEVVGDEKVVLMVVQS